jgi:hypothetical protein
MDAYTKLFERITREDFFYIGLDDIIFIDDELVNQQWQRLISDVMNQGEIYIRSYGRNAKKSEYFKSLYLELFGNPNIRIDPSNNTRPTRLLEDCTVYSKKEKEGKTVIFNYQVSHLFGKTKNPFLFACPWNVAYIPKYLDPFTGHETLGEHREAFQSILMPLVINRFHNYIEEYNTLISPFLDNLDDALNYVRDRHELDNKEFENFKRDARSELSPIH